MSNKLLNDIDSANIPILNMNSVNCQILVNVLTSVPVLRQNTVIKYYATWNTLLVLRK